jgi:hypothetical protein
MELYLFSFLYVFIAQTGTSQNDVALKKTASFIVNKWESSHDRRINKQGVKRNSRKEENWERVGLPCSQEALPYSIIPCGMFLEMNYFLLFSNVSTCIIGRIPGTKVDTSCYSVILVSKFYCNHYCLLTVRLSGWQRALCNVDLAHNKSLCQALGFVCPSASCSSVPFSTYSGLFHKHPAYYGCHITKTNTARLNWRNR